MQNVSTPPSEMFLTLSNGRSGSTWLTTMLGECPGVVTRGEAKWDVTRYKPGPQHILLGPGRHSARSQLLHQFYFLNEQSRRDVTHMGSKFVLDKHDFYHDAHIDRIEETIEPELKLVHLKRKYQDVFLSYNLRGPYHAVAARTKKGELADGAMLRVLQPEERIPDVSPLLIHTTPKQLATVPESTVAPGYNKISFADMVEELAAYFCVDLILHEIMRRRDAKTYVKYENLNAEMPVILDHLAVSAKSEQIDDVIKNPLTKKLPRKKENFLFPPNIVQETAVTLDFAFDELVSSGKKISDIARWAEHKQDKVLEIAVPDLASCCRDLPKSGPFWKRKPSAILSSADGVVALRPTRGVK